MSNLNFPKIGDKTDLRPLFTSKDAIKISDPIGLQKMPTRALLIYSDMLEAKLKKDLKLTKYKLPFNSDFHKYLNISAHSNRDKDIIVIKVGIGAPVTAIVAEDLISAGVKQIVLLGSAGGVGKNLSLGDIVVCTKALRDEGTSHHYIENSVFVNSNKDLTNSIKQLAERHGIKFTEGPTWTIDALYAETKKELDQYSQSGILTVEMEASALFAVAQKRRIKSSAIFMISDLINGQQWTGLREHQLDVGISNLSKIGLIYTKQTQ